jgi:hypothetical protein
LSDDGDAVENFMKAKYSPETDGLYKAACPAKSLPLEVPALLAIGLNDVDIPVDMVEDFFWNAKKIAHEVIHANSLSNKDMEDNGMVRVDSPSLNWVVPPSIKLLKIANANHYTIVNAEDNAWRKVYDELIDLCPSLSDVPKVVSNDDLEMVIAKRKRPSVRNAIKTGDTVIAPSQQSSNSTMGIVTYTNSTAAPAYATISNSSSLSDIQNSGSQDIVESKEDKGVGNRSSNLSNDSPSCSTNYQQVNTTPNNDIPELFSFPAPSATKKNTSFFSL